MLLLWTHKVPILWIGKHERYCRETSASKCINWGVISIFSPINAIGAAKKKFPTSVNKKNSSSLRTQLDSIVVICLIRVFGEHNVKIKWNFLFLSAKSVNIILAHLHDFYFAFRVLGYFLPNSSYNTSLLQGRPKSCLSLFLTSII